MKLLKSWNGLKKGDYVLFHKIKYSYDWLGRIENNFIVNDIGQIEIFYHPLFQQDNRKSKLGEFSMFFFKNKIHRKGSWICYKLTEKEKQKYLDKLMILNI